MKILIKLLIVVLCVVRLVGCMSDSNSNDSTKQQANVEQNTAEVSETSPVSEAAPEPEPEPEKYVDTNDPSDPRSQAYLGAYCGKDEIATIMHATDEMIKDAAMEYLTQKGYIDDEYQWDLRIIEGDGYGNFILKAELKKMYIMDSRVHNIIGYMVGWQLMNNIDGGSTTSILNLYGYDVSKFGNSKRDLEEKQRLQDLMDKNEKDAKITIKTQFDWGVPRY